MSNTFEKARQFIYLNARPLEFARWKLYFENGSPEEVLRALAAYQNADGGFGHGLESDALCPASSPIQTSEATNDLRQLGLYDAGHPIVSGILRYLESGSAFDGHCWNSVTPEVNDYPHAPWWTFVESTSTDHRNYNPTALLAGYLLRAAKPDSSAYRLGRRIALECYEYYAERDLECEMHLLPCLRTLCMDVAAVEPTLFDHASMRKRIEAGLAQCLRNDAENWGKGYCAMPSNFISGPQDPLLAVVGDLAQREADFLIETQQEDGAWPISWSWNDFPDAFAVSANHWQSCIILKNILTLLGMGKIHP